MYLMLYVKVKNEVCCDYDVTSTVCCLQYDSSQRSDNANRRSPPTVPLKPFRCIYLPPRAPPKTFRMRKGHWEPHSGPFFAIFWTFLWNMYGITLRCDLNLEVPILSKFTLEIQFNVKR